MKIIVTIVILLLLVGAYYRAQITHETDETINRKDHDSFIFKKTNKK